MTDVTMTEDLDLPGGGDPRNVEVSVYVADGATGDPLAVAHYNAGDVALNRSIVGVARLSVDNGGIDPDGSWSLDLPPSSTLTPTGAVYAVKVTGSTVPGAVRYFEVPDVDGPHVVADHLVEVSAATT